MRALPALTLIAALLPATAQAQDKCAPPKNLGVLQMKRAQGGSDVIPVGLNGVEKLFLFDTGGSVTQIARGTAQELGLPLRQGNIHMYDLAGHVSRDQVRVDSFTFGSMPGRNAVLPVSPPAPFEGIFAPDLLLAYDVGVDFGADTLSFYSPDHCPGAVPEGQPAARAQAPITLQGTHIIVPVTLDGQALDAVIDTGAGGSDLRIDVAQRLFMLPLGDADTPENGILNGVAALKTYRHVFKSLTFGSVTITNPGLTLIPDMMGREAQSSADLNRPVRALAGAGAPKMIIGMDVLRRMHLYFAFKEKKLYITPASNLQPVVSTAPRPALSPQQRLANMLAVVSAQIAANPGNAELWNARCFLRGQARSELDAAISDCDQALKLQPGTVAFLDSRAMVLYLQGKYREALDAYDAILTRDPKFAASLLMRGYARGKLGDQPGKDADIAAARASQLNIQARFQDMGIID